MNTYELLKLGHIVFVAVSGSLFVYRFLHFNIRRGIPLHGALRILPHVNDTLLLACAIGMLVIIELNPFTSPWLLAKIVALFIYIGFGAICMRAAPGSRRQVISFIASLVVFTYIVAVALTRQLSPF